jgi:hypothetical protein
MLRTDPKRVPADWLLRPQFKLWPPQRHRALLWVMANLVVFRIHQGRDLTLHDYLDFLRLAKWKLYQTNDRTACVGKYLTNIDTEELPNA